MVMQINSKNNGVSDCKLQEVFLQKNLLSLQSLEKIKTQAACFNQTVFQHMMQYQLIDPEKLRDACVDFFQLQKIIIDYKKINHMMIEKFPHQIFKKNLILPVEIKQQHLIIVISNPDDMDLAKTLSFQLGLSVEMQFSRYDTLFRLHNDYISNQHYHDIHNKNHSAQTITHQLLSDAIHRGASDIHFEPYQQNFRIRFRIDGLLREIIFLPTYLIDAVISCIKVLANLDIAIKRMPQDGRLTFHTYLGFFKDCRVSTCPTIYSEKIVIRLLDANTQSRSINQLGLQLRDQKIILQSLAQPQGLILVTGPTGSGKTITLYTLLNLLNEYHRNITTIEDPVEMHIEGINQTSINIKSGLTFSHILRALLRQDPDVIMIGEIRDQETAEMAIRAAQTGHLVLSTLHTNSASEAITRLSHMGIAPFHLCAALTLIVAQRLVRKLCLYCANGCAHCTDGFLGRIGIFELMPMNETIKQMILDKKPHSVIDQCNQENGYFNLWQSALESVQNKFTTMDEIYRVIPYKENKNHVPT